MHLSIRGIVLGFVLSAACAAPPVGVPTPTGSASPTPPTTSSPASPTTPATARPSPTSSPVAGVIPPGKVELPSGAGISAPSGNVVWVLAGIAPALLFRSLDRGDTWEARPLPPGARSAEISFVSDRIGWVRTSDDTTGCRPDAVTLWRTDDAGATYRPIKPAGLGEDACGGVFSFVDPLRGFYSSSSETRTPAVYRTADGGQSWTASALSAAEGKFDPRSPVSAGKVSAFGTTLLVRLNGRFGDEGGQVIYRSTDGGATWSIVTTVANREPVSFVTATRWIEIAPGIEDRETTDAGATWHAFASDYQQAAPVSPAVIFADASVGYATVRGSIQRTTDGGAHWTQIKTPGT